MKVKIRRFCKPQTIYRTAVVAGRHFAIHRTIPTIEGKQPTQRWTVTHKATGLGVIQTNDIKLARIVLRVLDRQPFDFTVLPRNAKTQAHAYENASEMTRNVPPQVMGWIHSIRYRLD